MAGQERAGGLEALIVDLRGVIDAQAAEIVVLKEQVAKLTLLLEEARRGGKRQAAPFSKGDPLPDPKRPGRKPGKAYGKRSERSVPERVDRELDAATPTVCPDCGGEIVADGVHEQYVCEVPDARPFVTRIRVHVGHCTGCRRRVQGRHPEQHSNALGAAGVLLGPRAFAIGHLLHYRYGLSFARSAAVLGEMFGLAVSRAALCRGAASTALELASTHTAIEAAVNTSPAVTMDETGWRVGGRRRWLWVAATRKATVFRVCEGRGYNDATTLLDGDYDGVLVRDGWAPYRAYEKATHQTCIAHLARRAHELKQELPVHEHGFAARVGEILDEALAWRDAERPVEQRVEAATELADRLRVLCDGAVLGEASQRFARHLTRENSAMFTFLTHDSDATNWRGEQAIRPAVVNRKTHGGNRTDHGARTLSIITSVLVTARQQGHDAIETLTRLARAPAPTLAFTIH